MQLDIYEHRTTQYANGEWSKESVYGHYVKHGMTVCGRNVDTHGWFKVDTPISSLEAACRNRGILPCQNCLRLYAKSRKRRA